MEVHSRLRRSGAASAGAAMVARIDTSHVAAEMICSTRHDFFPGASRLVVPSFVFRLIDIELSPRYLAIVACNWRST